VRTHSPHSALKQQDAQVGAKVEEEHVALLVCHIEAKPLANYAVPRRSKFTIHRLFDAARRILSNETAGERAKEGVERACV
jgi:hypothetical protein